MTTLFYDIAKRKQKRCAYLLKDYWIDVGRMRELSQANLDIKLEYETK
jgi:NDP-sugar pyrophosphorylase family protein